MSDDSRGGPPDSLPESDDPFVVLAVAHDADAKTLKRAHAKLIRRFRPDRDPDNFKRVQAAYEQAKRWSNLHVQIAATAAQSPLDPEPGAALGEAANSAPPPTPGRAKLWPLTPPPTRAIGRVDWIAEGIGRGAHFDPDELAALGRDTFVQLSAHPNARWPALAKLAQRDFALELHSERFEQLLAEDQITRALHEVDAMLGELVAEPRLEAQIWRVAAYAAWRYYPESQRLAGNLADGLDLPYEQDLLVTAYDDIRRVAAVWARVRRRPIPPAFERFVELSRVVTGPLSGELKAALHEEFLAEPDAYIDVVTRMATEGPELGPEPQQGLAFVWESFALEAPYGVPSYTLLDEGERASLDTALMQVEQQLAPSTTRSPGKFVLQILLVAFALWIGLVVRPVWGGFLIGILAYFKREAPKVNRVELRKQAHRALVHAACAGDLPPGCTLEHVERNPAHFPQLASVSADLHGDRALDAMSVIGWTVTRWDDEA